MPTKMNPRRMIQIALANLAPESVYLSISARITARNIASRRSTPPEIKFFPRFVQPGDTVVDVGGNRGVYTYHLSRLVGPSGHVHTFEPMPPNLHILRHTVKRYKLDNVVVHPQACGEKAERTTFCMPMDHGIPELAGAHQGTLGLTFDCESVRLDDVIDGPISFLKVDVEGAELFVLRGAQRLLRTSRPVVLFEASELTSRYGYAPQEAFDFLASVGYEVFNGRMEPCPSFVEVLDHFAIPVNTAGNCL